MTSNHRSTYFDIVKAVAIWLVVLGHCIQSFYYNYQEISMELAIYMFHMPLFMFISGYFFYPSVQKTSLCKYCFRKFQRLYIPSLFWGLMNVLIIGGGKLLRGKPIDYSYLIDLCFTGAWYLTVLFLIILIGAVIEHTPYRRKTIIWIAIYVVIYFLPNWWMIKELKFLIPFFVVAILSRQYNIEFKSHLTALFGIIAFMLCLVIYDWGYSMYAMKDNVWEFDYHLKAVVRFVGGLSGIIVVIYLCHYLQLNNVVQTALCVIGMTTLPIYVLHQNFLMLISLSGAVIAQWLFCFMSSFLIVIISYYAYKLLSKNKLMGRIMFGEI